MARPKKRKVRVVFQGREPEDPLTLLLAVEEAFRPIVLEIEVREREDESAIVAPVANEELETIAITAAAKALDENDERHRVKRSESKALSDDLPSAETLKGWSDDHAAHRAREAIRERKNLENWVVDTLSVGFHIVAKVTRIWAAGQA